MTTATQINIHRPEFSHADVFIPEQDGQNPFVSVNLTGNTSLFYTDPEAMRKLAFELEFYANELEKEVGRA